MTGSPIESYGKENETGALGEGLEYRADQDGCAPLIVQIALRIPPNGAAEDPAALEEIVVISDQNPWRLPDLGSSWRPPSSDEDAGRISADLLPLWDPEAEEIPTQNPFAVTDDFSRVGFIEVFRIRFGRR